VKSLLLVANPTAQSGKNAQRIERAQALLLEQGMQAELFPTLPEGRTIAALAARLRQRPSDVVVAMGGDGTFREAASAVLDSGRADRVALGMLPTGTANDQGRSFGLGAGEEDLPVNVQVIAAGRETRLDAGNLAILDDASRELKRVWFFDSAGFGLSARILAVRNRDRETVAKLGPLKELYRDQWVYAGALLKTFLESQVVDDKFTAALEADGVSHTFHGLTDLIIKGTRVYGGAWVLDRTSHHDDGMFELVTFQGKLEWSSKAIVDLEGNPITEQLLNAVGIEHSKPIRGRRFELTLAPESSVPIAAQIDGEELSCTYQVRITVHQQALRLIVPERFASEPTSPA
jgi:diacylglycerol kinase family enzyme